MRRCSPQLLLEDLSAELDALFADRNVRGSCSDKPTANFLGRLSAEGTHRDWCHASRRDSDAVTLPAALTLGTHPRNPMPSGVIPEHWPRPASTVWAMADADELEAREWVATEITRLRSLSYDELLAMRAKPETRRETRHMVTAAGSPLVLMIGVAGEGPGGKIVDVMVNVWKPTTDSRGDRFTRFVGDSFTRPPDEPSGSR